MSEALEWSGEAFEFPDWDVGEATVPSAEGTRTTYLYVGLLQGFEERSIFTIDVPTESGEFRSIAVGFAKTIQDAKASVSEAINRLRSGPIIAW